MNSIITVVVNFRRQDMAVMGNSDAEISLVFHWATFLSVLSWNILSIS